MSAKRCTNWMPETKKSSDMQTIPPVVRARLPRYYRVLRELLGADILRVRSTELARRMGCTPSRIRQDLSLLGGIGLQGYGYNVKDLYSAIGNALGIPSHFEAVVVAGKNRQLGRMLVSLPAFHTRGVTLRALFTQESPAAQDPRSVSNPLSAQDLLSVQNSPAAQDLLGMQDDLTQAIVSHGLSLIHISEPTRP